MSAYACSAAGSARLTFPLGRILWLADVPVPEVAISDGLVCPSSGGHCHDEIIQLLVKIVVRVPSRRAAEWQSRVSPEFGFRHRELACSGSQALSSALRNLDDLVAEVQESPSSSRLFSYRTTKYDYCLSPARRSSEAT